jgi:hypothetical protein
MIQIRVAHSARARLSQTLAVLRHSRELAEAVLAGTLNRSQNDEGFGRRRAQGRATVRKIEKVKPRGSISTRMDRAMLR